MLQDIAPYVYHNEYTPCAPQPEDYLLIYREQELLLRQEEASFSLPKIKELAWSAEQLHISCRYLFYQATVFSQSVFCATPILLTWLSPASLECSFPIGTTHTASAAAVPLL